MKRLRISLVGLGLAVEPHAKSLIDLSDRVDVRWAASRSKERVASFANAYPFPVTTDIEAALADPEVDAVLLLTPPSTHLDLARRCFEQRKHLLIEKPLELTVARAAELVESANITDCKLGVVLQHRFRESSLRAQEIVRSGALGCVEAASVRIPWWRPQSYYDEPGRGTLVRDGGGVLLTQAIHTLDVFRSLVGVASVDAARVTTTSLHRMECEDVAMALISLGNGAPGMILATTAAFPGQSEAIEIFGSKGSLLIKGDEMEFRTLDGHVENCGTASDGGSGDNPMAFSHECHRALISDFVDAVVGDRPPMVSGADALATQELIARIIEVSKETGTAGP